jgi:predicted nucleic acid-binding protein
LKVFIDTSAFCALTIPKDQHNPTAKAIYKQILSKNAILYSSNFIMDEVYTLLRTRSNHTTAIKFMDQIDRSRITIFRITEDIEISAKSIFRQFENIKLSFTDCTSFVLINQFDIDAVSAFDEHFKYYPYPHSIELLK